MKLFAVGDLHLSGNRDKTMDMFGEQWKNHFERICDDWQSRVCQQDIVLIPGDISWAMKSEDALEDLHSIGKLNGRKVICRGNHDYWWHSLPQVSSMLREGMYAVANSAILLDNVVVCGTRGWLFPSQDQQLTSGDEKIYKRELIRLELSLESAKKLQQGAEIVVMMHYPPASVNCMDTGFTSLMEKYGAKMCVYGHLHGSSINWGISGNHNMVCYKLVSCDSLGFRLAELQL